MKFIDLTGEKFGKWIIVKRDVDTNNKRSRWICKCECGISRSVSSDRLISGRSLSCGCFKRRNYDKYGKERYKRIHGIWRNMNYRCYNKKSKSYKYYGERGVTVCEEWKTVNPFVEWAINNGYDDNLEIDRINPYGNYEPSNCRWITMVEQQNNKTDNVYLEYNGTTKTMAQWSKEYEIRQNVFRKRLLSKWPLERILHEPIHKNKSSILRNN